MPTVEWFRSKIAHRKRKERYHLEAMKDESISSAKVKDHEKKADYNRKSVIQLEQQQEMEHGARFAEDREEIDNIYKEIESLTKVNPDDIQIPELHQKIRQIKQRMRGQFSPVASE